MALHRAANGRRRPIALLAAAALVGGAVTALATWSAPAQAATTTQNRPTDANVYVACGYGYVVVAGGPTCESLPDVLAEVLADNSASAPAATIELAPGNYCPIDLTQAAKDADSSDTTGTLYRKLTITGIGYAWYLDSSGHSASSGSEAELSQFRWSPTWCGGDAGAQALVSADSGYDPVPITLRNLTVNGTPDGAATGAPSTGIFVHGLGLTLRDVLVENNTSAGLDYANGSSSSLQVNASAFIGNGVGVTMGYRGTIESSTIANNTVGVNGDGHYVHLYDDTITGNGTGITQPAINGSLQLGVTNTILLGNTINCGANAYFWWEAGEGASGHNLIGADSDPGNNCRTNVNDGTDDVSSPLTAMPGDGLYDSGVTPWFSPPAAAEGAGETCAVSDQREVGLGIHDPCDIGSVNNSSGSPDATVNGGGEANVGSMVVGTSTTESTSFAVGTGLVELGDVTLDDHDGAFTLAPQGNNCTLATLIKDGNYCSVKLLVAPVAIGVASATLTIASTAGDVVLHISVTGTPPPPTALTVTRTDDPVGDGSCLGTGDDDCSLRQAIAAIAPGGTITLGSHEYVLTRDELHVDRPMTIVGAGANHTSISQRSDVDGTGNEAEVLWVDGARGVTIRGIDLGAGGGHNGGPHSQYGDEGGAIYAVGSELALDHVRVDGSFAAGAGGGIYAEDTQLSITHSEISLNALTGSDTAGGGIYAVDSEVDVDNSTLDSNTATSNISVAGQTLGTDGDGAGGAIYAGSGSVVSLSFVTIAGNYADDGAGIMADTSSGEEGEDDDAEAPGVTIRDSLLFGTANCGGDALTSGGHNISDDDTCRLSGPADHDDTPYYLYTLERNGGQTSNMAPHSDGPAVDAAADADCAAYATDQRDLARPQGDHCDIGAVEVAAQPGGGSGSSSSAPPPPDSSSSSAPPPPSGSSGSSSAPPPPSDSGSSSTSPNPPASCTDAPFSDVPTAATFCGSISWLVAQHITTGYPDGGFHPVATVSRQALASFLYRLTHDGHDAPACSSAPFPDVPATSEFCGAIAWLQTAGLSTGYASGSFQPGAGISRQAIAAFLYRLTHEGADAPACSSAPFPDVPATSEFCGAIAWLRTAGLSTGYVDGSFQPGNPISRQAIAAFLYRYTQLG